MAKIPKRFQLIALACVAGIGLFMLLFLGGEPRYHGQSLRLWINKLKAGNPGEQAKAREALRAMGQSAVPYLVEILEGEDSPFKVKMVKKYGPRYPFIYRQWPLIWPQSRAEAASALGEIGPLASNAIPALTRMSQTNDVIISAPATAALIKIRGEPIEPLVKALDDIDSAQWLTTVHTLAEFGTNAGAAVPALCRGLQSTNVSVYVKAAYAMGYIHSDAERCVPALITAVNQGKLMNTIWALGQFGSEARPAVPVIQQHLHDSDAMVRQAVLSSLADILPPDQYKTLVPALLISINDPDPNLNVVARMLLKQIAPDAAEKAGVK